jgi:hypothetical protein
MREVATAIDGHQADHLVALAASGPSLRATQLVRSGAVGMTKDLTENL